MPGIFEFLALARKNRQFTLREVQAKTGISNGYLSQLETGKIKQPSPVVLDKLSRLYGIPYAETLGAAGYPVPEQPGAMPFLPQTLPSGGPACGIEACLNTVTEGRTVQLFRPNRRLFAQGEPADSVYFLRRGRVKITVLSRQGREGVVAILGPGDFFGEGCLAAQPVRATSATAITSCVAVRLETPVMTRLLHHEPSFSRLFIAYLLARNSRIQDDLVDQLFNSSEKRLARVLLLLSGFQDTGASEAVIPKLSQETLAGMIGTTRSRVSHFMTRFRQLGFIASGGQLRINCSRLSSFLREVV